MMPTFGVVRFQGHRWVPPVPLPLFLLWPFAVVCLGTARLLDRSKPVEADKLRAAVHVFRELRGLSIEVDAAHGKQVRVWFV